MNSKAYSSKGQRDAGGQRLSEFHSVLERGDTVHGTLSADLASNSDSSSETSDKCRLGPTGSVCVVANGSLQTKVPGDREESHQPKMYFDTSRPVDLAATRTEDQLRGVNDRLQKVEDDIKERKAGQESLADEFAKRTSPRDKTVTELEEDAQRLEKEIQKRGTSVAWIDGNDPMYRQLAEHQSKAKQLYKTEAARLREERDAAKKEVEALKKQLREKEVSS